MHAQKQQIRSLTWADVHLGLYQNLIIFQSFVCQTMEINAAKNCHDKLRVKIFPFIGILFQFTRANLAKLTISKTLM